MKVISFRIEDEILDRIERIVEKGLFKDKSEFIRYAIKRILEVYEK